MILPDYRKALTGRTFSQRWQPCAIEVGRRPFWWWLWRLFK